MALSDIPVLRQIKRGWARLRHSIAQEVPDRVAKCEFDCERADCSPAEIRDCERRTDYALSAELARDGSPSQTQDLEPGRPPGDESR